MRNSFLKFLPAPHIFAIKFTALLILSACLMDGFAAQRKLDQLLVYGEDFIFSVKEPVGWSGDTKNAEAFNANVVLHEAEKPVDSWSGLIRILVNSKTDENISADMAEDMRGYKAQYAHVQFKGLSIATAHYRCIAKVFFTPGESYEYVAYVNPGPGKPILFSVSMNTGKSEASAKELQAYMSAVQSLTLLKP